MDENKLFVLYEKISTEVNREAYGSYLTVMELYDPLATNMDMQLNSEYSLGISNIVTDYLRGYE